VKLLWDASLRSQDKEEAKRTVATIVERAGWPIRYAQKWV
jgi:hypothetical protein